MEIVLQKVSLDIQLWNISSECAKREWKAWVGEKDFISSVIIKIVVALGALKPKNHKAAKQIRRAAAVI